MICHSWFLVWKGRNATLQPHGRVTVHGCTVRSPAKLHQSHANGSRGIRKSRSILLLHLWASVACYRVIFTFTLCIFIYLIQMLLSSGMVSTTKFISKYPAFKFLPRGHCSSWRWRFSLLLGVNVETLVLFETVMWPIPSTTFPVHPLYRSLGVPQGRSIK